MATSSHKDMGLNPLEGDADILAERAALEDSKHDGASAPTSRCPFASGKAHLTMSRNTHVPSDGTRWVLDAVGGVPALLRMTTRFYDKVFKDPVLDKFVRSHDDPHAERLATWIAEKWGDPAKPWTTERRTRPHEAVELANGMRAVVHDRSSAHWAAWHSAKREPERVGDHFQLDESRIWMRLHFWAGREAGLIGDATPLQRVFTDLFSRLIGRFIAIYERTAPMCARESLRWSADPDNIKRYEAAGRMDDVIGVPAHRVAAELPEDEVDTEWPFDNARQV